MIILLFTAVFFYLLGFAAGYIANKQAVEKVNGGIISLAYKGKDMIENITRDSVKPGVIRRPTAKELQNRNLPPKVKEGNEAMKETLDNIPELQEHKRLLKQLENIQP